MRQIFQQLGKDVRIVHPHPVPPTLTFIDPQKIIRPLKELTNEERHWIDHADLFLVLDTSSWSQLGDMADVFKAYRGKRIVLDHHLRGDDIGAERFIDADAEATGALVVRAAKALGVPLTKEIADPVFVALSTDTGWFRFSSVTPETYHATADLMEAGANPTELYRELHEQESLGRIRLIGRTLSKTESHLDGKLMITWILQEDFNAAGALPSDSEDIINSLLTIRDSQMAVLFSELKKGGFKVSFRSRCSIDCSDIAAQFSGGGHQKAAGATLTLPFEKTKQAVIAAITKAFETV